MRSHTIAHGSVFAAMPLREAAHALGGDVVGTNRILAPGPGHSRADRSLSIWIEASAPEGFWVHSFASDDALVCRDYVREKLGLPSWRTPRRENRPEKSAEVQDHTAGQVEEHRARQRAKALLLWKKSQPPTGTAVERYLRSRGIALDELPASIRYLPPRPPNCPRAAMIAAFAFAHEPEPGRIAVSPNVIAGVHLTLLRGDGLGKASTGRDKIMSGSSAGTPIVIAPMSDGMGLAITEGIEDGLSVHLATGLGVWAAGSATRLPLLTEAVPDYVDLVTIVADGDDVGQHYAHLLAERLVRRAHAVDIQTPTDEARAAS
jgi:Toprim domain